MTFVYVNIMTINVSYLNNLLSYIILLYFGKELLVNFI